LDEPEEEASTKKSVTCTVPETQPKLLQQSKATALGRGHETNGRTRAPRHQHESAERRSSQPMTAYLKRRYATALGPRLHHRFTSTHASATNSVVQTQTLCYSCAYATCSCCSALGGRPAGASVCSTNARLGNKESGAGPRLIWPLDRTKESGNRARMTR